MLSESIQLILVILCFFAYLVFNWILRYYFVILGFEKTGSAARRHRAYAARFNMLQRILLVPFFTACADKRKTQYAVLGVMNNMTLVIFFAFSALLLLQHFGVTAGTTIMFHRVLLISDALLVCLEWIIVNYKKAQ